MQNIEVKVLDDHSDPGGMMMFLAKLTQRGHAVKSMSDLEDLLSSSANPLPKTVERVAALPHGTIKRFCPITIAIVGASRRFLAQARTNQVGFNYVSASLQYSDYSSDASFVVPYSVLAEDHRRGNRELTKLYLDSCTSSMDTYRLLSGYTDNDTAGYAAPQGLRNILIMQGNHQSWDYFIRTRTCNRNTNETQYVTLKIWEALLQTEYGPEFFKYAGPDCMYGRCREGKMCCGKPMKHYADEYESFYIPSMILDTQWPLLRGAK